MMIPCGTDAPVYHYPFTTGGVIAANIAVFAWAGLGDIHVEPYYLTLGQGLHPVQWLTHMFLHASLLHLLGNMIFLWCFGLVVEGKVGWWKFLLIYLAIGAAVGALIQVAMLGGPRTSALGASAAIFGILAIACVWAPVNEVNFVWVLYYRLFHFDATLLTAACWYVGWDIFGLIVTGFAFSGATAHLLGAVMGLTLGFVMVLYKAVDCEGYDLLSVVRDRTGAESVSAQAPGKRQKETQPDPQLIAERIRLARPQVSAFLQQGNVDAAIRLFDRLRQLNPGIHWQKNELHALIVQLLRSRQPDRAIPYMEEFIERSPDSADPIRLQKARVVLVQQRRPAKALRFLASVSYESLSPRQQDLFGRVRRRARQMRDEGVLELSDE